MYHTVSNGFRDNSSVYSGSSNATGGSGAFYGGRGVPRSNSTSDLFDIPVSGSGGNCRKPKPSYAGPRASFASSGRSNSLQHFSTGQQLSNSQQVKLRDAHHQRGRIPDPGSVRPGLYQSPRHSTSNYSLEPQTSLNSIPERRQPRYVLTPYQLQRKQMKDAFQFPNGENFTPRNRLTNHLPRSSSSVALTQVRNPALNPALNPLSRSQSMRSLPVRPAQPRKPPNVAKSPSPVESGSSNSSYNSMRDHSSSGSTNQSSRPSTHSSIKNIPPTADKQNSRLSMTIEPQEVEEKPPATVIAKELPAKNIVQGASTGSVKRKNPSTAPNRKEVENEPVKRNNSISKFGSFLKKIFNRQSSRSPSPTPSSTSSVTAKKKKRQRIAPGATVPSTTQALASEPVSASSAVASYKEGLNAASEMESKDASNPKTVVEIESSAEDENDEDGDDPLMDTDLVFDSLLLKADLNRPSCLQKQTELRQKLKEMPSLSLHPSSDSIDVEIRHEPLEEESNIDYELISEFSRLGKFIEKSDKIMEGKPTNLPIRSPKRPTIANKESARSFYHPRRRGVDSSHDLIARLYRDWEFVHLDACIQMRRNLLEDKQLRFAHDVYVKDTWCAADYERSDRKFIRNRRRTMQLKDQGFIESIKLELNEYKKNDMIIHQESAHFTHFFS